MTHEIEAIARFISRMQARPEHRIANCGVKSAEIAAQFREFGTAFAVRTDRGVINAVLGHDSDQELERTWLFGPVIADPSRWNEIAESLWDEVMAGVPGTSKTLELGYAAENQRVREFGERHGFEIFSEGRSMLFSQDRIDELPDSPDVRFLEAGDERSVGTLHQLLFPNAWPTAKQMLERLNEHRQVFVASSPDGAVGYLHAEVKPQHGEGFIEFVGVAEAARGRGVAKRMVASALRWMLAFEGIEEIELFVRDDNPVAQRVYASVGFTTGVGLVGARKLIELEPTG